MESFAAGTQVTLTINHANNGNALTLTDLQVQVVDTDGVELAPFATPVGFNPSNTSTQVTIAGSLNQTSEKIDVRQINVKLVSASDTYNQTIYYKLEGDLTKLTPMVDSFMTFPESVVVRARMSDDLEYFDELPDALKAVALENAFTNLVKIGFNGQIYATPTVSTCAVYIKDFTAEQLKALNPKFLLALKKAQIAEANVLVEHSPVRDKIRQGIISETIGESSMFFKQGAVPGTKVAGMSDEAYGAMSDFIYKSTTSAQIWKLGRA